MAANGLSQIGDNARGEYQGPGWAEWLLGLAATALAATQLRALIETPPPQTALGYYFQEPYIRLAHILATGVDLALVLTVAAWIFFWKKAELWSVIVAALCVAGAGLAWGELWLASKPDPTRVYTLQGLPFAPVNNMGLLGAAVFCGYLALKLPTGNMARIPSALTRLAIWVGFFGLQWILYDIFVKQPPTP